MELTRTFTCEAGNTIFFNILTRSGLVQVTTGEMLPLNLPHRQIGAETIMYFFLLELDYGPVSISCPDCPTLRTCKIT